MVIWAGIAGYLFWDEIPTVWIAVGGTAVMVRGKYRYVGSRIN